MINITKDTIIGDILDVAPQTAPIFLSIGMHCLGCPSSRGETVEEACMVHGIDVDKLTHQHLLRDEPGCWLNLDAFHMGVGGDDSWSPSVSPEFILQHCQLRYTFSWHQKH